MKGLVICLIVIILGMTVTASAGAQQPEDDTLFQAATLGGLLAGIYDGDVTFAQLRDVGDFGLGTFDALDGEMIAVDGEFFRVDTEGVASIVPDESETPFAVVTIFDADIELSVESDMSCADLQSLISAELPSPNLMYAIRVEATFHNLTTRSVPKQEPPYVGLAKALEGQVTFDFDDISGTMVGYWLPDYLAGVNVAGYHFHFVDADRVTGGHVLDCAIASAVVEIDTSDELRLVLPESFIDGDLSQEN